MTDIISIRILSLSVISFSSPMFSGYKTLSPSQYSYSSHLTLVVLYRYHFHRFVKMTVSLSFLSFSIKSVRHWPCIPSLLPVSKTIVLSFESHFSSSSLYWDIKLPHLPFSSKPLLSVENLCLSSMLYWLLIPSPRPLSFLSVNVVLAAF